MEMVLWMVLGVTAFVSALRAARSDRALQVGRWAVGLLFVVGGALVNAVYLATGTDYGDFAEASMIPFVADTWTSLVAPNQEFFIGLLVAFEAVAGVLVLLGGRATEAGLIGIIAFHVALMTFGWFFWIWSVPMLIALSLLLRAQHLSLQREARRDLDRAQGKTLQGS